MDIGVGVVVIFVILDCVCCGCIGFFISLVKWFCDGVSSGWLNCWLGVVCGLVDCGDYVVWCCVIYDLWFCCYGVVDWIV